MLVEKEKDFSWTFDKYDSTIASSYGVPGLSKNDCIYESSGVIYVSQTFSRNGRNELSKKLSMTPVDRFVSHGPRTDGFVIASPICIGEQCS